MAILNEKTLHKLECVAGILENEEITLADWLGNPFHETDGVDSEEVREQLNYYVGYFQGVSDSLGVNAFDHCMKTLLPTDETG